MYNVWLKWEEYLSLMYSYIAHQIIVEDVKNIEILL